MTSEQPAKQWTAAQRAVDALLGLAVLAAEADDIVGADLALVAVANIKGHFDHEVLVEPFRRDEGRADIP
jgi:hypothetical protein